MKFMNAEANHQDGRLCCTVNPLSCRQYTSKCSRAYALKVCSSLPHKSKQKHPFLQSQPKSFPETSAQQGDLHIKQGFILILLVWVLKNAIIHLKMLKIFFLLAGSLRAPAFPLHSCVSVPPRSSSTGGGDSLRSVSTISGQTRWWLGRSCSSVEQSSAQQHQLWVNSPALPRHFTSLRLGLLAVKIG